MSLRHRIQDQTFQKYVMAVLTRQAAWLEGMRWLPLGDDAASTGLERFGIAKEKAE